MRYSADLLAKSPETVLVGLASAGNRDAFAEIVGRRQTWIRNLLRRCCRDETLADDLSQQVFMQAWRSIRQLHDADRLGPWLKRMAINTWLQYRRRNDPLRHAEEHDDLASMQQPQTSIALDLDRALSTLPEEVRLCVVLAYHERMTHAEIAEFTEIPLGTIKSHIRRGSQKLREELAAYVNPQEATT